MDGHFLVATHLSSLGSPPPFVHVVPISHPNTSLAVEPDADILNDHASTGSILTSPLTGTILIRVLHGGIIVEIVSLSTPVPALRLVFPAAVLPAPSLFLSEDPELHLLSITETGSMVRVIIPIDGLNLWEDQVANIWQREYFIRNLPVEHARQCFVHAHGLHCAAVSLPNGILLRLDAEVMGYDAHDDEEWSETLCYPGSFFSSLTSFLPIHSSAPNATDIISLASHPWPTDINNIWTLSRDRTLRLWKGKLGCVASKVLPASSNFRDLSASGSSNAKHILLDSERQYLIKIFSSIPEGQDRANLYTLVFIPTPSSTSGGFFYLLKTFNDQLAEVGIIECPKHTIHCHLQDFAISEDADGKNVLYALWDQQGQSVVERICFDPTKPLPESRHWIRSQYIQEPELTPAFMEEQLLSPGSLSEKFLQAVMKPGVFSSLTLQTALDQYTEACLNIPGRTPTPLTATYSNLCENIAAVVGCTVTLNRDPTRGGFQYANYWTALKRDWEGFVARCREIERSARWPLALSAEGPDGVIVVERERVGSLVVEDLPVWLRKSLEFDLPIPSEDYSIFTVAWDLRSRLGPHMLSNLENRVVDIMHQEIAFSFAEILQDQARRLDFKGNLDEGADSWFVGRLQNIKDLDKATRNALDAIGGFELAIKRESTDAELLNPPPPSQWLRSQSAAFATVSIEARYDLCLGLIILLFFLSENLQQWDASLLAEVFAVFRGLAVLRYVATQPLEPKEDHKQNEVEASTPDDVVTQMRNMNVSKSKSKIASKSSLLYLLVPPSPYPDGIASASHNFLDSTGLLQSITPANAIRLEILFCNRVRTLGFSEVTAEILSWFPRTPAATYLQAQVFFAQGRPDDAAQLLEKLAGCFGVANLTLEDSEALSAVLPNSQPMESQYAFYLFAADLFRNTYVYHEVQFSRLAIQAAPPGADTAPLWNSVVKGLADLALYEDAYASAMVTPFENEKREMATQLAIRMCEEKAVDKLMAFDFGGVASEVEDALAFKARNDDPRNQPSYSKILYTWYSRRGDYRNASLTMYQRAQKIKEIITSAQTFLDLAEDQLDSLLVAVNALHLVDEKSAWVLMAASPDSPGKGQKYSKHIPESKYISSKHDAQIINLADMEYEFVLLKAQIDIIRRDPSILQSPEFRLPPALIVMRLAHTNQYTQALATARSLKIDMTDVFIHLTQQCLRLTRNPGVVVQEDTSGWLLTDQAGSWQGTPADRGWRYLQQSLKRHDGSENDYRYTKASFETILSVGRSSSSPPWLIDALVKHQPEYLIRLSLKYENISDAVNYTYALVLKSDKQVARESSRDASTTWLPYALIDQVLIAADAQITPPQNLIQLKTAINNRLKRMQKLSQNTS